MRSIFRKTNSLRFEKAAVLACALGVQSCGALVITPMWDPTIENHVGSAAIKAGITAALRDYQARFSDSISVTILFQDVKDGLGASSTYFQSIDYADFRARLVNHATTTNDTLALAHLPSGNSSPVDGLRSMTLTLPHLRALGVDAAPDPGQPDSTVSLNLDIMNFTRPGANPNNYDLRATVYHEVNEVLGLNSALDGLNNDDPAPTDAIGVMDLFRYDQNGRRSFNTTLKSFAYFSLDGTHRIVQFNQDATGDFHDWDSNDTRVSAHVQDAFAGPDSEVDQSEAELMALDAIGYTPIVVVTTPPLIANPTFAGGRFGFDIAGKSGQTVILDASTDLKTWTPVWTNTLSGTVHYTDAQSGVRSNREFRARTP